MDTIQKYDDIDCYEIIGRRYKMEDVTLIKKTYLFNRDCILAAIFDGHGGRNIAYHVSEILVDELNKAYLKLSESNDMNLDGSIRQTIENAFMNIDEDLRSLNGWECGSTANVCFIFDDLIVCANIGDTRAVLFRNNNSIDLSRDHKPNDPIERERIDKTGAKVDFWSGAWRVDTLAVARAFGDFYLKNNPKLLPKEQPVVAFPDITIIKRTSDDKYLIIGCDGLWDVLDNEIIKSELIKYSSNDNINNVNNIAKHLVDEAFNRNSGDNISCVVIKL